MSSHHFVREGQEPALIALNWNDTLHQYALQLLEWQPFFICVESCLHQVLMSGLKPDAIIGEENESYVHLYPLRFFENDILFNLPSQSSILLEEINDSILGQIKSNQLTVYSNEYKYYSTNAASWNKILVPGKSAFELIDNKKILLKEGDEFKNQPALVIEEL